MKLYDVLTTQTDYVTYTLEAASAEDAENRFLRDSTDTTTRRGKLTVTEVRPVPEDELYYSPDNN